MTARDAEGANETAPLAERPLKWPAAAVSLFRATRHSFDGFAFALKSERALRQEAFALIIAVPLACALTPDLFQRALLIGALLLVMAVELLNTGAEKICDLVMPHRHPAVKAIKDMGSAAVFCTLGACLLLWGAAALTRLG